MTKKCQGCGHEITENQVISGVHFMTHLLLEKLNTMPKEYGIIAMIQLLVSQAPWHKAEFLEEM